MLRWDLETEFPSTVYTVLFYAKEEEGEFEDYVYDGEDRVISYFYKILGEGLEDMCFILQLINKIS